MIVWIKCRRLHRQPKRAPLEIALYLTIADELAKRHLLADLEVDEETVHLAVLHVTLDLVVVVLIQAIEGLVAFQVSEEARILRLGAGYERDYLLRVK